ncbi:glutathione transferase [Alcanivorax xiamenensis]|uniref:Glutathione transferase n=1 Tax=Alcanivorax xiamenensis TaxID=1177156 RepID=A0ABQ6YCY8_9GAMM|nr:VOC family protein [Alcanivorax xiamenensis]KAF0807669.1 glutathione transferase [Alcanivorax xiamenensis]
MHRGGGQGINHITLSVSDLDRSLRFYTDIVGMTAAVRWDGGAYLRSGGDWVCLSLDNRTRQGPLPEYSHVAFSLTESAFWEKADLLRRHGVSLWKDNRSEGDSLYFLDPDGHKLEFHRGDLASRLRALREKPYSGLQWLEDEAGDKSS